MHDRQRVLIEDGPAVEPRIQKREGGEQHQALVHGGMASVAKTQIHERGKHEHVGERDGIKRSHLFDCFRAGTCGVPDELVGGREHAQHHHETCQAKAKHAYPAMQRDAMNRDERNLRDEQKNPKRESRAVDVQQEVGERGFEHSR